MSEKINDKLSESEKLNRISERVYLYSFFLSVGMVFGASIGTAITRYITGTEINLIPDNLYGFIKDIIFYFTIPVTIKIIGDKIPDVIRLFEVFRIDRKPTKQLNTKLNRSVG
jgi:hypothetical protein